VGHRINFSSRVCGLYEESGGYGGGERYLPLNQNRESPAIAGRENRPSHECGELAGILAGLAGWRASERQQSRARFKNGN
jgi:hypothetical protein